MLTITWLGLHLLSASTSTFLVPPTFGMERTKWAGWTQNPVRPTMDADRPRSHNNSVIDGTRLTMRALATGAWRVPTASMNDSACGALAADAFVTAWCAPFAGRATWRGRK